MSSLIGCLARPARHAATRNSILRLPARSVTRFQRGRPLVQPSPILWTLGASRSFSWNPFGGSGKSQAAAPTPVSEPPAFSQPTPEEKISSTAASPPAVNNSALVQAEASVPADVNGADVLSDTLTDAATNLATVPAPLKYGDLDALGLVSWTPAGITPWILETVQVSTGLPWWNVVVLTTIGVRIALVPLVIGAQRMQAKLAPIQGKLTEFRNESLRAKAAGDMFGAQQAMQKQAMLLSKHDVSPFKQMGMSLGQVIVQIGFFLGIRRMCLASIEQLKTGGFGWVADLTVADPYYILPAISVVLMNLQMSLSKRDLLATGSPNALHALNVMRIVTLIGIPFMAYLPAALNLNIVTSVAFISAQTVILRIPALRQRLSLAKLPPLTNEKTPGMKDSFSLVKDWYKRKLIEGQRKAEERERKLRMVQRQRPRL